MRRSIPRVSRYLIGTHLGLFIALYVVSWGMLAMALARRLTVLPSSRSRSAVLTAFGGAALITAVWYFPWSFSIRQIGLRSRKLVCDGTHSTVRRREAAGTSTALSGCRVCLE